MAYKFQFGQAILSGALDQEGDVQIKDQSGNTRIKLDDNGAISGSGLFHAVGAATFESTLATSGSITSGAGVAAGGAITTATSIDGSGDLTMGTITMTGMSVDADGDTIVKTLAMPDDGTVGNATNADLLTLAAAELTVKANSDFTIAKAGGLKLADGAVTSTAAELNFLDGSTAGTAIASKAVVLDASKGIASLGQVSAVGLSGSLRFSLDVAANSGIGMTPFNNSANVSDLGISASFMAAADVAVAADQLVMLDADGSVKRESFADYATAIAGDGLAASSGVLSVSLTELTEAAVNVAADSLIFIDADGNVTRRDTFADYAAALAGTPSASGLDSASGVLTLDIDALGVEDIATGDTIAFNDDGDNGLHKITFDNVITKAPALLTAATIDVSADHFMFLDGGATGDAKSESIADLVSGIAGAGLSDSGGVLSVQGNAVTAFVDGTAFSEGYNFASGSLGGAAALPASPSVGDVVTVKASNAGDISITTAGSHTIDGQDSILLESPFAAVTMVYMVANAWKIV